MRVVGVVAFFGVVLAGCSRPPHGTSLPHAVGERREAAGTSDLFRDVAPEAGLSFHWSHGGKSPLMILETLGHGCAFLDYDRDGLLDVLLVGNRGLVLYHNLGNGHFEDVTARSGLTTDGEFWGVAVGDYDNDGYPDLYLTGYGRCALYHNTGHGTFEDVTARAGLAARGPYDVVTAAAFVDLDGDGKLDLFAGRYILFKPDTRRFCIYRGVKAGCGVKNYDPDFPRVYRNNGNGTFTDVTKAWGFDKANGRCLGVAVRALDRGRGVALYASNDEEPGDLFVPRDGRYVNIGTSSGTAYNRDGLTQGGMGVDWGDYNNDGRIDLVVATFQGELASLYRNDGHDLFSEVGASLGIAARTGVYVKWTAKFFDYDNDGWLDLLFTNGHTQDNINQAEKDITYPQPMLLYHNEQGRLYQDVSSQGGPAFRQPFVGRGAAFGDFDNDGRVDVLLVDEEGAPKLLHNEDRSGHHWLGVRLMGVQSNRDGIGARVLVTADGKTYMRDQQLAGGYISAHDPRLHFGLGAARHIEKAVVRWPNGHVDTVKDALMDSYIEITEGRGRTGRNAGETGKRR